MCRYPRQLRTPENSAQAQPKGSNSTVSLGPCPGQRWHLQPGHQLPPQTPPLPSCAEAPPPPGPSSASTAQGSSTAGGTMEAAREPTPTGGSRKLRAAGACATHQTRPAGTGGGSGRRRLLLPGRPGPRRRRGSSWGRSERGSRNRWGRGWSGAREHLRLAGGRNVY